MWCITQIRIGRFSDFSFFHQLSIFCFLPPLNFFHHFVKSVVFATSHSQCFSFPSLFYITELLFIVILCIFFFIIWPPILFTSPLLYIASLLNWFSTSSEFGLHSRPSHFVFVRLSFFSAQSHFFSSPLLPYPSSFLPSIFLSSPQLQHGVLFPWQQYANELVDLLASLNYSSLLLSLLSCFAVDKYACHGLLLTQKHLLT